MSLAHKSITSHQASNNTTDWSTMDWKQELQNNIHNVADLKAFIDLSADEERDIKQVVESHPMNIPRYYLSLIDRNDPNDPIRKLAVPTGDELVVAGQMGATTGDPYGDDKHDKGNGVLHKYGYTALVVATEYCSMYCRHCFRKRLVGLPNDQTVQNFRAAADYIATHPEISNVVVSGGDPMMLPTTIIRSMLDTLRSIPHLNFVRIGTRAPVVYPLRFQDDELIEYLADFNQTKTLYVPTHFNHPNEITPEATNAVARLRNAGIAVNNQAVLLRGINDDEETLVQLMSGLTRIGVNPYYLYQCMPVSRVRHHFQVPLKRGVDMVDRARSRLDGYAKRFKFILGHDIGKIEICGRSGDNLILKQIHARAEEQEQASRIMIRRLDEQAGWLDDMEPITL
ncbi:KamA family radical SAM protein [Sedimenticola sp.]|uniref:KamA family radical SAM protein n=1 Tax=Sedimenticola sp. TaxID=1940285 RepID=UPI00258F7C07|nr:KamA family radical SAM protein [Sedimenticola sp.]MCW8902584.1 KamA family radical SAM protein [Sedimenticola sp.]